MARPPRIVLPGQPAHVVQRGHNRQPVFFDPLDYRQYLSHLADAAKKTACNVHAYVLMTNHVHLLVTPTRADSLSRLMQSVNRRYVRFINTRYQRRGTLWEGRFKSALIDTDRYLLACSRYIEMNAVRAGMVDTPAVYRWSSYRCNAFGLQDHLVTPHATYLMLANTGDARRKAYRQLFDHELDESDLSAIRTATQKGQPIGRNSLVIKAGKLLGRRLERLSHGGDRRSDTFLARNA